jgi:TolA-binding protein
MKTIDFNYYIERYLSQEMEHAEKLWFENELKGNAELTQELALRRKIDSVLQDREVFDLRGKLNAIEKERGEENSWTAARRRMLRYAAVAAIFIVTGTTVWKSTAPLSNDHLFNKYYEVPATAGNSATRSAGEISDATYQAALKEYREGQFDLAIKHFLDFTSAHQSIDQGIQMGVNMMVGNSLAETKQYNAASHSYKKVVDHDDNLYIEDARWLLSLCYLKTGDNANARANLEMIASSASRHKKDASAILRRMKK